MWFWYLLRECLPICKRDLQLKPKQWPQLHPSLPPHPYCHFLRFIRNNSCSNKSQVTKSALTSFSLGEFNLQQHVFENIFIPFLPCMVFFRFCGPCSTAMQFFLLGSDPDCMALMLGGNYVPFATIILFLEFCFEIVCSEECAYGLV
jgi:hypothetical protein